MVLFILEFGGHNTKLVSRILDCPIAVSNDKSVRHCDE